ncbi:MAG: hypothetical protein EPN85_11790 [Bacteroidetes bacterium]|nr:MAG: hypothetical protein EPN85_11790 [Bacteroidota bacterium]
MELPLQILIVLVPSLVVLFVTYFMMKNNAETMQRFFQEEIKLRKEEIKAMNQNITGPLRVQAYERMILFLERISPDNLVMRLHQPDMNSRQLHGEVIRALRSEFEHNLPQQVYLSIGAWQMIQTAKEETAKLVNLTVDSIPSATGLELGQAIINNASKLKRLPTEVAIEYLKKEFAENF